MAVTRQRKRAPHRGALFALWLAGFFLAGFSPHGRSQTECAIGQADETVAVSYVYDGDTVKLGDGRKLRFIGINTPEIDHDGGQSEPYAVEAREYLKRLLDKGQLKLVYGIERNDRYGRLLAYPFLVDGRSINVLLLQEGLAAALVVPPNTSYYQCYQRVENKARRQGVGIWSHSRYQATSPARLERQQPGFRLVEGRLSRVGESRSSLWLEMEGAMALRIPRKDLSNFVGMDFDALIGRRVVARGWPRFHKGKWRLTVRHPAALEIH